MSDLGVNLWLRCRRRPELALARKGFNPSDRTGVLGAICDTLVELQVAEFVVELLEPVQMRATDLRRTLEQLPAIAEAMDRGARSVDLSFGEGERARRLRFEPYVGGLHGEIMMHVHSPDDEFQDSFALAPPWAAKAMLVDLVNTFIELAEWVCPMLTDTPAFRLWLWEVRPLRREGRMAA